MKKSFQFAKIDQLEVISFDNSLESFNANGVSGTIKENIQNSLDARLHKDYELPVRVTITLDEIERQHLPGIDEAFEHIDALEGQNSYTKETIANMQKRKDIKNVKVITIEDSNTTGLKNAKNGQSGNVNDTFGNYAYKKGVHAESSDEDHEISRGGSHGIGKIANNAASSIHLMYFANCDGEYNQHLGGTIQLVEHILDNQGYRATGYYTDVANESTSRYIPFENNNAHPIFKKETQGLKIIIPYISEEFYNFKEIVRAVCDNFFMAILNNSLVVEVNNETKDSIEINQDTISDIVEDARFYEEDLNSSDANFTPYYVNTYLVQKPEKLLVRSKTDSYEFDLYFTYDEELNKGKVAIFRTIGMKIQDHKVKNNYRKPFNAVLIGGAKEDQYLKSLENESHTSISAESIRDEVEKSNATRFINNLNKELGKVINRHFEEANPTEGELNTDDLIYQSEISFSTELNKENITIQVTDGPKLVKDNGKEKRNKQGSHCSNADKGKKKKRKPRIIQNDDDSSLTKYTIDSSLVERISLNKTEIINLDVSSIKPNENSITCNLLIQVIDGEGKISKDEFSLNEYYRQIIHQDTSENYSFSNNRIEEIRIDDGTLKLEFMKKSYDSSSLKYHYQLEVVE